MNSDNYEILEDVYGSNPILTIITRRVANKRLNEFEEHLKCLEKQSLKSFIHLLIIDKIGAGMLAANKSFQLVKGQIKTPYVYLLDDDDLLIDEDFVLQIQSIIELEKPDIIFVKARIETGKDFIYPHPNCWCKIPKDLKKMRGHIGGGCVVITKELFNENIHHFELESFGDYAMISNILENKKLKIYWLNRIVVNSIPRRGKL